MKRFIVFAYDHDYPGGGWNDFKDSFDEFGAADQEARRQLANAGWRQGLCTNRRHRYRPCLGIRMTD